MTNVRIERLEVEGAPAVRVVIDRADKLNALNSYLIDAVTAAFASLAAEADLRAVVLEGAGPKSWVVGADIAEMAGLDGPAAATFIARLHGAMRAIRDLPAPVIAKVHGFALGAGMELAAACDLRIASTAARFGMPEVQVGLPSVIEASLLPRLMGLGRAGRLMLTGEVIDAERAFAWGFVEEVVAPDALDGAVDAALADLCRAGVHAVRRQKRLLRQWEAMTPDAAAEASIAEFAASFETDEPTVMLSAFTKKP
ncbi:MAG: enoyl-CoA hydratase [Rhodospirillaceae bacterium]